MALIHDIALAAGVTLQGRGSVALVQASDSEMFLKECTRRRVIVVGIEGFESAGAGVRPLLDAIADFADLKDPDVAVGESKNFIARVCSRRNALSEHLWFDFVITDLMDGPICPRNKSKGAIISG